MDQIRASGCAPAGRRRARPGPIVSAPMITSRPSSVGAASNRAATRCVDFGATLTGPLPSVASVNSPEGSRVPRSLQLVTWRRTTSHSLSSFSSSPTSASAPLSAEARTAIRQRPETKTGAGSSAAAARRLAVGLRVVLVLVGGSPIGFLAGQDQPLRAGARWPVARPRNRPPRPGRRCRASRCRGRSSGLRRRPPSQGSCRPAKSSFKVNVANARSASPPRMAFPERSRRGATSLNAGSLRMEATMVARPASGVVATSGTPRNVTERQAVRQGEHVEVGRRLVGDEPGVVPGDGVAVARTGVGVAGDVRGRGVRHRAGQQGEEGDERRQERPPGSEAPNHRDHPPDCARAHPAWASGRRRSSAILWSSSSVAGGTHGERCVFPGGAGRTS